MSILSVQSHVTYGHVGNSVATFLLKSMGHEVWPVHTVHFSNHPGYEHVRGSVVPATEITALFEGLVLNGWTRDCQAVLGGYMGSVENARATQAAVVDLKKSHSNAVYLCDPVMGDNPEGVYVSQDLVDYYRYDACHRADVLTPNVFELELLTGMRCTSPAEVQKAALSLIALGVDTVLVTSVGEYQNLATIGAMAITADQAWQVEAPRLEQTAKGAGDAFAALWLGHRLQGLPIELALSQAVSGVHHLLTESQNKPAGELPLVQCVQEAIKPANLFLATDV